MLSLALALLLAAPPLVVDAARGPYQTVQSALDAVPAGGDQRVVIEVRPGTYRERVTIGRDKPPLTLRGENAVTTVITWDWSARTVVEGQPVGTAGSGTFNVAAADFQAERLTFENTAGPTAGQAAAVMVTGDRAVFRACRLLGWQDTLYAGRGRQYYRDCQIAGSVDFIFGSAAAVFERCELVCRAPGYVTAQARETAAEPGGFVFRDCAVTGEAPAGSVWLGRPWRDFARVLFDACVLGPQVRPEGWHNWNEPARERTAWLAEAGCVGPGADRSRRVAWSREASPEVRRELAPATFLAGADGWDPVDPRVFAPDSFWYRELPADAPLADNSAALTADFVRQKKAYYGTVGINTSAYASPIYVVGPDQPTLTVGFNNCQQKTWIDPQLLEQWTAVPLPEWASQADGTDAEMCVWQPTTDTLWEFWVAKQTDAGGWAACWGGKMDRVSRSSGIWRHPYGTTATGLPFLGGQIGIEELRRGEIRHALGLALVDLANWDVASWPANRSDGWNPNKEPNRIAEGQRCRLDPTLDLDTLKLHPVGRIIAEAAQKYGFVVWDKAGAITLRAENPKGWTNRGLPNPYPELFGGTPAYAILNGIPWERLQFLPLDYGKPPRP